MGGENDPDAPEPAAALEAVKARPGDVGVRRYGERRPAVTASAASASERYLRSGRRKPAAQSVEQKKGPKQESQSAKKKNACVRGGDERK